MATFGIGASRPLPGRGASAGFRFTLYAILSVVCMYFDQRGGWLERARFALQATAYPLQLAVNSPAAAWEWMAEAFESREKLQAENAELRRNTRELELRSLRFAALARENARLRGLKEALPPVAERWLAAEVVSVELNSLRQRLLINRGASNGVFKSQSVLTDDGLLGQTTRVGPWSAEIILITDPEHAVPVQIERTGLRTIAVGAGAASALVLPYLPANTDIRKDDLLMTSGLGGVFPAGYPVARVTEVRRGAEQPFAHVRAAPLARLDADREVMLVWFHEGHPAAPATATAAGEMTAGSPAIQPQARPPVVQPPVPQATESVPRPAQRVTTNARTRAPRVPVPVEEENSASEDAVAPAVPPEDVAAAPVTQPGDEPAAPVTQAGDDAPVTQAGDDAPVTQAGDDAPVTQPAPPQDEEPVPEAAEEPGR